MQPLGLERNLPSLPNFCQSPVQSSKLVTPALTHLSLSDPTPDSTDELLEYTFSELVGERVTAAALESDSQTVVTLEYGLLSF